MTLLVVTRYEVTDPADGESFRLRARDALEALCAQPGCRGGHVGRALDAPTRWVLQTEWDSVGTYRRALSTYEVKVRAVPLMQEQVDEATAYESLVAGGPDGVADGTSDLAPGAAWAHPRRADDGAQPGDADR
ncbi:MAG TPA: antibiotic biosynthesis monooxygenase family protein [Actinomycetales bacterium]|nr:antibiotic biosynthesis monooxygenase family protein [Actinomycetales bacterium]